MQMSCSSRRACGIPLPACRRDTLRNRALQCNAKTSQFAGVDVKPLEKIIVATSAAIVLQLSPLAAAESQASDVAAVGTCLLTSCQTQLAKCIGDFNCLQDLICLQGCQGKPDEQACEIRCGDLYEDEAVTVFNACAVSDQKCVPQAVTDNYPLPNDEILDDSFDTSQFQGRWYITAGYNKLFDCFDCQEHYFTSPEPGKLFGNIQWRIPRPDGDFLERSTVQRFLQDPVHPSKLYNHDNDYLHYEDDWYVVSWRPDEYAFIYYKGNNDAWLGYGGATVYTRAAEFPKAYEPEMRKAAESVGLRWDDFTITDNSCPDHPKRASFPFNLFRGAQQLEASIVREFEEDLQSFGRGFTVLETAVQNELSAEEQLIRREIADATRVLEKMEQSYDKYGVFKFTK
eukprot:jgi/Ulvmu1/5179/UM021_0196.1